MKVNPEQITYIKEKFSLLKTKEDLLDLINDTNKILFGKKAKELRIKTLNYYANPQYSGKKRYVTFKVNKKSGGKRTIHAPNKSLKVILHALNLILQSIAEPHKAAMGFVPDKSIVDNAQLHIGSTYVFNIDLKDFFYSFDRNRVKLGFMYEPFNLKEPLAFFLASLVTHPVKIDGKIKYVLPQGSPTSPTLTNILSRKLDRRLSGLAKRFGVKYSRYADDITFSANHNPFRKKEFLDELERIITDLGFQINRKKVRLQENVHRQEVTGLIVNEKVNVRRRYVKQLRMWLYYWEKYGYSKAMQIFSKDYKDDKGHIKKNVPDLWLVLEGKLLFLKMVKGENDSTYIKLKQRFDRLMEKDKPQTTLTTRLFGTNLDDIAKEALKYAAVGAVTKSDPTDEVINRIIDIWEKHGIEKAMEEYNKVFKKR